MGGIDTLFPNVYWVHSKESHPKFFELFKLLVKLI